MFAMKIQMDEEKILRENVINLEKVYKALDEIFAEKGLVKGEIEVDGTRVYRGNESNKDFGRFALVSLSLREVNKWFVPNCKKWLLGENETVPGVWGWEDLIVDGKKGGVA